MNNVSLMGRLVRDIEIKTTATGMLIGNFTLALDKGLSKDKKQELEAMNKPTADFIRCLSFGKTAEILGQYVGKGNRLAIEGRIQTGSYENQQGQRVYTTDIIVDRFSFIDFQDSEGGYQQTQPQEEITQGFVPFEDNEIPF